MYTNIGKLVSSYDTHVKPVYVAQNTNLLEALMFIKENKTTVLIIVKDLIKKRQEHSIRFQSHNEMLVKTKGDKNILGFLFLKDIF